MIISAGYEALTKKILSKKFNYTRKTKNRALTRIRTTTSNPKGL